MSGSLSAGQVDRLGVAAPLDVEDARVGPAVLVVADEQALRVGRERRLARAGEPEEHRGAARRPVRRRRAVHRQHAPLRHQVVHDREDALLHLAGVLGPQDHDLAVLDAQVDARLGGHAGRQAVGGELAGVVDHVVGLAEARQLLAGRPDHHDVHGRSWSGVGDQGPALGDPGLGVVVDRLLIPPRRREVPTDVPLQHNFLYPARSDG